MVDYAKNRTILDLIAIVIKQEPILLNLEKKAMMNLNGLTDEILPFPAIHNQFILED